MTKRVRAKEGPAYIAALPRLKGMVDLDQRRNQFRMPLSLAMSGISELELTADDFDERLPSQ